DANVFGAAKIKSADGTVPKRKKKTKAQENEEARERMRLLYEKCPTRLTEQKEVYRLLHRSYQSFSLYHNFLRMYLFFKYNKRI
uniref:hypothetical protein n=1 Tax=Salmonella sp. M275 TaxID=3240302 RepID=UPI00352B3FDF